MNFNTFWKFGILIFLSLFIISCGSENTEIISDDSHIEANWENIESLESLNLDTEIQDLLDRVENVDGEN